MLAERYLRKRYEAGLKEGAEKGKAEGKVEGLTKAWQVWQAWNQRRMDAEKAGQPFPPALNNPT
jgi:flagellar biosynthesis/type III secretory pathway protein FliH